MCFLDPTFRPVSYRWTQTDVQEVYDAAVRFSNKYIDAVLVMERWEESVDLLIDYFSIPLRYVCNEVESVQYIRFVYFFLDTPAISCRSRKKIAKEVNKNVHLYHIERPFFSTEQLQALNSSIKLDIQLYDLLAERMNKQQQEIKDRITREKKEYQENLRQLERHMQRNHKPLF